jgi:hypothetical protein
MTYPMGAGAKFYLLVYMFSVPIMYVVCSGPTRLAPMIGVLDFVVQSVFSFSLLRSVPDAISSRCVLFRFATFGP